MQDLCEVKVSTANSWGNVTIYSVLEMTSYIVKTKRHIFMLGSEWIVDEVDATWGKATSAAAKCLHTGLPMNYQCRRRCDVAKQEQMDPLKYRPVHLVVSPGFMVSNIKVFSLFVCFIWVVYLQIPIQMNCNVLMLPCCEAPKQETQPDFVMRGWEK